MTPDVEIFQVLARHNVPFVMMLWTKLGFLDLFDYVPGLPDHDVSELVATSTVSEGRRYASLEALKQMKRAAGRPKDLLDLENLPDPLA